MSIKNDVTFELVQGQQYYIKIGYDSLDASYLDALYSIKFIERGAIDSILLVECAQGNEFNVPLDAQNLRGLEGHTISVKYDTEHLEIIDLCSFTKKLEVNIGEIANTDITITSISGGRIVMAINKDILNGKQWSGILNIFKFKAIKSGTTTITAEYQ
jgi:hypothetical protein